MIPVVTIDGPSGSGKGTISRLLAQELGWHFLDSGSLYRVLALAAIKSEVDVADVDCIESLAKNFDLRFVADTEPESNIYLDGKDVTTEIRTEECSRVASLIASISKVRSVLFFRQRSFLRLPGLVADGRDMGTIVFNESKAKIFLTASVKERARRRCLQLQAQGIDANLRAISQELVARDARDEQRTTAPLKPAADAKLIDTTDLSINEVLKLVMEYVELRYEGPV